MTETPSQSNAIHEHIEVDVPPAQAAPGRAEVVMKAFAQAYPDRISHAEFRNNDWAVLLGGQWFYYADGRLLPENLRHRAQEYSAPPIYSNYPAELPPWTPPTAEVSERMRGMTDRRLNQRERQVIPRAIYFFDALWRIRTREESWDRVKQIRFLGHSVMMHYSILTQLSLVEERILALSRTNSEVRRWVDSIGTVEGWNWRNISASENRSMHAYGAAIDILPRSLGNQATYWQWSAQHYPEWWAIPYSRRYHPPNDVIKAFESFGFIWGGKWMYFDTMHFEYRPEAIILNNMPLIDHRSLF